jgi:hypothetical protein
MKRKPILITEVVGTAAALLGAAAPVSGCVCLRDERPLVEGVAVQRGGWSACSALASLRGIGERAERDCGKPRR